ncbi:PH domain-containing protein [Microbacterium sp. P03]|uniref:PH domain-containing protein n=1 Tax=Microbacterium sp. P03 TaxID=3366946 RepID=UPI003745017F
MTSIPPGLPEVPAAPVNPARSTTRSPLSDGEWHRLHPLTPLLRGGLFLVVVIGIVIANLRERLIDWFLPALVPDLPDGELPPDPLDYVLEHNLILIGLLAVLGIAAIVVGIFWLSWRFHTFRITGHEVEVRSGVLFRTHRRAPLDRVQGVNLTRPMIARLLGTAKLEVVGAGLDANVSLEYLSTQSAEAVRADILRLASGMRLAAETPALPGESSAARARRVAGTVSDGITGIIVGAEEPVAEPESVVHIPVLRLVASHLLSGSTVSLLVLLVAIVVGSTMGSPWVLFAFIPALLGFGAYWVRGITRALRYSIAPTPSGVRITFGLFTTITEILPPGRVHAVEVTQSILWRPAGWWSVTVNRLSGRSVESGQDQFTTVLPVGTRADVERVLRLLLTDLPESEWPLVFEHGILGPQQDDPYTNTPRRARILRPLSWRRNGFLLARDAMFLRRGLIWRALAIFPLARMQSVALEQGPLDRALRVASARIHTITGRVHGGLGAIDRDTAVDLFADTSQRAISAAATDRSHRWAGSDQVPVEPDMSGVRE